MCAITLAILLTNCSCEQRLARIERRCGIPITATIDTVVEVRDSIYLDTVFDVLRDTMTFTRDSITVRVIRDTVHRTTHITVTSPPVVKEIKVAVPVTITAMATWANWWAMGGNLVSGYRWVMVPLLLIAVALWFVRFLTKKY